MVLPIKKKWFDMILSGEKKEEYRKRRTTITKTKNKELIAELRRRGLKVRFA